MIYLASPYTHRDASVREQRFLLAEHACALLLRKRIHVYSPIVHCHGLAVRHSLPTDAKFWQDYNYAFMRRFNELWTLTIDGWQASVGVADERLLAAHARIQRFFLHVDFEKEHFRVEPDPVTVFETLG